MRIPTEDSTVQKFIVTLHYRWFTKRNRSSRRPSRLGAKVDGGPNG